MSVEFVSASQAADAVACDAPLRLVDTFGRVARDLRVSLTDRCNLRCSYCMPPEGLDWLPTEETLTDDEVVRLVRVGVERLGIRQVRFTGGEPLLRRGLEGIIEACSHMRTDEGEPLDLALTTNALGLAKRAQGLRDAGLNRVNISLDSLDPEHFAPMHPNPRTAEPHMNIINDQIKLEASNRTELKRKALEFTHEPRSQGQRRSFRPRRR